VTLVNAEISLASVATSIELDGLRHIAIEVEFHETLRMEPGDQLCWHSQDDAILGNFMNAGAMTLHIGRFAIVTACGSFMCGEADFLEVELLTNEVTCLACAAVAASAKRGLALEAMLYPAEPKKVIR
jgi:hypothetical protein